VNKGHWCLTILRLSDLLRIIPDSFDPFELVNVWHGTARRKCIEYLFLFYLQLHHHWIWIGGMIFLFDPVPLSELIFKGIRRFLLAGQVKLDRHVRTFCSPLSGYLPLLLEKNSSWYRCFRWIINLFCFMFAFTLVLGAAVTILAAKLPSSLTKITDVHLNKHLFADAKAAQM
jgi:hypothetical protein